jgi:hypothetical protein
MHSLPSGLIFNCLSGQLSRGLLIMLFIFLRVLNKVNVGVEKELQNVTTPLA